MSRNSFLAIGGAAAVAVLGVVVIAIVAPGGQAAPTPSPGIGHYSYDRPDTGHYSYDGRPQTPDEVTQEEFERRTKTLDEASQREQPDFGIENLDYSDE